ncbi:MAG: TlyA family rRNA (cytidine-2'-O)-methyltransferase [Caldibacillus debilis]|uniref:TlyA family RNA methyltransferase n=1 Tax=Caldibacillus debilis TaxID=301148 RepID=UPI000E392168|nr:TlyA family RNA methyltransferase [Caldibacillus debilis]REJ14350.1 MAG: TlyA family rRNA (cytidine-2'-O)-methyltransferase [Caldibacillus debilis]
MKEEKIRIDQLLVEKGFFETREKAKRAIMAGLVYTENRRLEKPGEKVPKSLPVAVKGDPMPYVSRGGFKLEKALKAFGLSVKGKIFLDVGASTGGFTDCALQNGAKLSYAVDVGYNQLAWKLRTDPRVVVMERTNFRYMKPEDLRCGMAEFAAIDVSFISLKKILPPLKAMLVPDSDVVALIKPQFEAGKESVGKKGIVRDPAVHEKVIRDIVRFARSEGYGPRGLTFSPITGGDGNIEFLLHLKWPCPDPDAADLPDSAIGEVVKQAHREFHK